MVHAQQNSGGGGAAVATTTGGSRVRDIPVWLTIPIVLLCLAGGAYLLYTMFIRDDRGKAREVTVDDVKGKGIAAVSGRGGGGLGGGGRWRTPGATVAAPQGDGIVETLKRANGSNYRVRAGTARMDVVMDAKGAPSLTLSYPDFLSTDQYLYLQNRRQVLDDPKMREFLGATPEQVKKLNEMPPPDTMRATADEKKKLIDLMGEWRGAAADKKAPAEKAVVAALAEIAKGRFEETKQYAIARVDMVKTILTPEQVKMIRDPQRPVAPKAGGGIAPAKGAGVAPAKAPAPAKAHAVPAPSLPAGVPAPAPK